MDQRHQRKSIIARRPVPVEIWRGLRATSGADGTGKAILDHQKLSRRSILPVLTAHLPTQA